MNTDYFIDILKNYDENKMKLFLLENGKKQKPISPFLFINKEDEKGKVDEYGKQDWRNYRY